MNSSVLGSFSHQNLVFLTKFRFPKAPLKPSLLPTNLPQSHLSLRCSSHKTPQNSPLSSLFRPAAVTLVAGAALLLCGLPIPSRASPIPTQTQSQSQTLTNIETQQEQELEARLDSEPNNPRLLRSLLDLKIKANKIYDAIWILDHLIDLEPGEAELQLLKCHLLIQTADTETAKHLFEQIIDKNPFSVEAYHGLIMTNREAEESLDGVLKRIENAIQMCKKAKRREDLRDFKLLKAQIKVVEGKYEEAIRVYEELVKEEPRDYRPYLCEGIVYTLMMKKDEAAKKFEKYRRLVPKGHPYAGFFDEGMIATKVFGQMEENRRSAGLKV